MMIDLHTHTNASDGTDSPEEMVSIAAREGFECVAITDHDTICGVERAVEAGERAGIRVITGLEMSAGGSSEIHILGYGDAARLRALRGELEGMRERRVERMEAMIKRLGDIGVRIPFDVVAGMAEGIMGRAHLAAALIEGGYASDVKDAFVKYLSPGKPGYVPRDKLSSADAIKLIRGAGAVPVIAHPGQYREGPPIEKGFLREMMDAGLMGIEAYHPSHDKDRCEQLRRLALSNGLLVTGGSDYHGGMKAVRLGEGLERWKRVREDIEPFFSAVYNRAR